MENLLMTTERKVETTEMSLTCGLVMPISSMDGYTSEHWSDVKSIITEAVEGISKPKFSVKLVSDADDVGVIQKRIVQNIYSSDIIVCDVSGKNPNVMFELGMRLAFDKPTIIVKDDKTDYSFDTGIIEHVPYPSDLRFSRIVTFKSMLADKVVATHKAAISSPDHSTFLKNFGKFQVANLTESIIPADKLVLEILTEIQEDISRLKRFEARTEPQTNLNKRTQFHLIIEKLIEDYLKKNPVLKLSDLTEQKDFYHYLENQVNTSQMFNTEGQFHEFVCKILEKMYSKEKFIR